MSIQGQHYPTTIITQARDPPVLVPKDIREDFERQLNYATVGGSADSGPGPVVAELFANIENQPMRMLDEEGAAFAPHAYVRNFVFLYFLFCFPQGYHEKFECHDEILCVRWRQ